MYAYSDSKCGKKSSFLGTSGSGGWPDKERIFADYRHPPFTNRPKLARLRPDSEPRSRTAIDVQWLHLRSVRRAA